MSYPLWERPAQCDRWIVRTVYEGKSRLTRKPQYRAYATGFRGDDTWASYMFGRYYGQTREEAEEKLRRRICRDIKAYNDWADARTRDTVRNEYSAEDICP
jgi:hypothetical protein